MKKMPRIGGKNPHEDFTRDDENPVMKTNKMCYSFICYHNLYTIVHENTDTGVCRPQIDADYWSFYGLLFSGPRYKKNQG